MFCNIMNASVTRLSHDRIHEFTSINLVSTFQKVMEGSGLEFTKKFRFSFGKVGQKFTSPNKFKLFRIILAIYEL